MKGPIQVSLRATWSILMVNATQRAKMAIEELAEVPWWNVRRRIELRALIDAALTDAAACRELLELAEGERVVSATSAVVPADHVDAQRAAGRGGLQ